MADVNPDDIRLATDSLIADLRRRLDLAVDIADDRIAITDLAIRYINCTDEEAATGEPYDELVHAVRVHERRRATVPPVLGSPSRVQVATVDADRIAQAIADPGSIVGCRFGPSWGEGHEAYRTDEEPVARWATRAVLAVLGQGDARPMPDVPPVETATVAGGVL